MSCVTPDVCYSMGGYCGGVCTTSSGVPGCYCFGSPSPSPTPTPTPSSLSVSLTSSQTALSVGQSVTINLSVSWNAPLPSNGTLSYSITISAGGKSATLTSSSLSIPLGATSFFAPLNVTVPNLGLSPGTYSATITAHATLSWSSGSLSGSGSINATYTEPASSPTPSPSSSPTPTPTPTPTSLNVSISVSQSQVSPGQTVAVNLTATWNTGLPSNGTLAYTVTLSAGGKSVTLTSGSLSVPLGATSVFVPLNVTIPDLGLSPGTYTGSISAQVTLTWSGGQLTAPGSFGVTYVQPSPSPSPTPTSSSTSPTVSISGRSASWDPSTVMLTVPFTVTNTSNSTITVQPNVTVEIPNFPTTAISATVTPQSATITPGSSQTFYVTFSPIQWLVTASKGGLLSNGAQVGGVIITIPNAVIQNANFCTGVCYSGNNAYLIPLTYNAPSTNNVYACPNSNVNVPIMTLKNKSNQSVTVSNLVIQASVTYPVSAGNWSTATENYTLLSTPVTIQPGGSYDVTLQFPSTSGLWGHVGCMGPGTFPASAGQSMYIDLSPMSITVNGTTVDYPTELTFAVINAVSPPKISLGLSYPGYGTQCTNGFVPASSGLSALPGTSIPLAINATSNELCTAWDGSISVTITGNNTGTSYYSNTFNLRFPPNSTVTTPTFTFTMPNEPVTVQYSASVPIPSGYQGCSWSNPLASGSATITPIQVNISQISGYPTATEPGQQISVALHFNYTANLSPQFTAHFTVTTASGQTLLDTDCNMCYASNPGTTAICILPAVTSPNYVSIDTASCGKMFTMPNESVNVTATLYNSLPLYSSCPSYQYVLKTVTWTIAPGIPSPSPSPSPTCYCTDLLSCAAAGGNIDGVCSEVNGILYYNCCFAPGTTPRAPLPTPPSPSPSPTVTPTTTVTPISTTVVPTPTTTPVSTVVSTSSPTPTTTATLPSPISVSPSSTAPIVQPTYYPPSTVTIIPTSAVTVSQAGKIVATVAVGLGAGLGMLVLANILSKRRFK